MQEAAFFDETVTPDRIKFLLDNTETRGGASVMEKVEGMKYILAVRCVGRASHSTSAATPHPSPLSLSPPPPPPCSKWRAAATPPSSTRTLCAT